MIKRLIATGAAVLLGTGLAAGCAAQPHPVTEPTLPAPRKARPG